MRNLITGRRLLGLASLLAVAASAPATAGVKDGVDAWTQGDYAAAIAEWEGPAAQGDPDAQFNMAQAYRLGRGVSPDPAKAREYYERAAAQGHVKAADNYGLLLFQEGQRERAIPYLNDAARRGDPRAQYVIGLAHFNGDLADKNWVRAYALVSLAHAAGLPQAAGALKQMDQYVPLADRQQAQLLAADIRRQGDAERTAQLAAADLTRGQGRSIESNTRVPQPVATLPVPPSSATGRAVEPSSPATAGADFARPKEPVLVAGTITPGPAPKPSSAQPNTPNRSAAAPSSYGKWRVQLGAFGVAGNAQKLWGRLSGRAEFAGKRAFYVPAGRLTKLQAGGFASRSDAQAACSKLKPTGQACIVTGG